jgi:hypothetical protein
VKGWRLYQRAASIFLLAGDSSLFDPVTFALSQHVLVSLAGDLTMHGRIEEHVDAPSFGSSLMR